MTEPGTQVAVLEAKGVTALIERAEHRLTPLLPDGLTLQRLQQEVFFVAQKNPDILKCSGASIVRSIARVLTWGLTIGDTAHLVPFGSECTAVADYKGLAQLMIASKAVRAIEGEVVYEGDEFEYALGLDAHLRHKPAPKAKRGRITAAYVIMRLTSNQSTFKVMAIEDIDEIRLSKSKQWRRGECPPWYAVKTVIRQMAKTMPKDPRLVNAFRVIDEEEREEVEPTPVDAEFEEMSDA